MQKSDYPRLFFDRPGIVPAISPLGTPWRHAESGLYRRVQLGLIGLQALPAGQESGTAA